MKTSCWVAALLCLSWQALGQGFDYRPGREYRSMNSGTYEVSIQKNGRTDVTLVNGARVFENAFPMVDLEGAEKPKPLAVDGTMTEQQSVNDALGEGNAILFKKGNCEWVIQVYPSQPFFTVQAAFINTSKKPVKVKALYPFAVGEPNKGGLGLGASAAEAIVLDNGSLAQQDVAYAKLGMGSRTSTWYLPVFNPASGQTLVAGFLTNVKAHTSVRISRSETSAPNMADVFRGQCIYDPPLEVAPGGRLDSEVMYISVAEGRPMEALERFGSAVAAYRPVRVRRLTLPHGWDSWNSRYHTDISEETMLAELDFLDKNLKRYGWTHFSLDDGWQLGRGNWEADPKKFPHGMKWFVDQAHARGITVGLWTDPFTIDPDSPIAREHPDWLVEAGGLGKGMLNKDQRLLDVTVPGAYEYLVALYQKIGNEWGVDALVEADFVYRLLFAESYAQQNLTRVEVFRLGMQAVLEGFGQDRSKFVMSMPPMAINGPLVDGIRVGNDCAPLWRKAPDRWPWGCVETLNNAAHRYFFAPVWVPDQDCAYFNHTTTRARWGTTEQPELTMDQSIAWLTGAALTGGVVKIGNAFSDLKPEEVTVLRKILPVLPTPARPVDIFEREQPAIWSLPIKTTIGEWQVVGVFNWNENESVTIPVSFAQLGLIDQRYTVFDFWSDTFYGTAQGKLDVKVGPGAMRLLGLRPYEDRPMFLSTDRHWSMGATDFTEMDWSASTRTLSGAFDGVADTDYTLTLLAPAPWRLSRVDVSTGPATAHMDTESKVVKISFHCAEAGPVRWSACF